MKGPSLNRSIRNHALFTAQMVANLFIGLIFVRIMAFQYGTSQTKAAFDVAFSVPFAIITLSGFSWIHSLVTVHFIRIRSERPRDASREMTSLFIVFGGAAFFLTALVMVFLDPTISMLAPGFNAEDRQLTKQLSQVLLPLVFIFGVTTVQSAIFVAYSVPIASELASLLTRLSAILLFLVPATGKEIQDMCLYLVAGSLLAVVFQASVLYFSCRIRPAIPAKILSPELLLVCRQGAYFMIGAVLAQVAALSMASLSTISQIGMAAAFTYALSLIGPVSTLIGKPLSQVCAPKLSRLDLTRQADVRSLIILSCRVFFAAVFAVFVLNTMGFSVIEIYLVGGEFTHESLEQTYAIFSIMTWSIPASALLWILLYPLIVDKNEMACAIVYGVGSLVQIALAFLLHGYYSVAGVAVAFVAGNIVQAALAVYFLYRRTIVTTPAMAPLRQAA